MTTPGPLALLGGVEHGPECPRIDRWLLERTGAQRPRVTVIPAASPRHTIRSTGSHSRRYWSALGARTRVLSPFSGPVEADETLSNADLVVLTGGVPGLLVRRLGSNGMWDRIAAHWRAGGALSGSSAGAMSLFQWRLGLRPPAPLALSPGLGLFGGHVVVPHYDRFVHPFGFMHRLTGWRQGLYGQGVLGIDEQTALLVHDGHQQVAGVGSITTIDADGWVRHEAGSTPSIDLALPSSSPPMVRRLVPQPTT